MRSWQLEGQRVEAKYLGEVVITGEVELSRVQYGGKVCHYIVLDRGFELHNGAIKREDGETVIVDDDQITEVISLELGEFHGS